MSSQWSGGSVIQFSILFLYELSTALLNGYISFPSKHKYLPYSLSVQNETISYCVLILHLLVSDVELFHVIFDHLDILSFFFWKGLFIKLLTMLCSCFPFLCSLFPALHLFSPPLSTSPLSALSLPLPFKSWMIQLHLDPVFLQKGKQTRHVYSAKDLRAQEEKLFIPKNSNHRGWL